LAGKRLGRYDRSRPPQEAGLNMRLPRWIKTTARRVLPARVYGSIQAHAGRRLANRWLRNNGVFELALKVAERFGYEVQSGPFQGMKYTRAAVLSRHATPSLLGQYERQIYPSLVAAAGQADMVIDIGHAEGYYAVGFARLGKRVIAFDANPHERRVCQEMAQVNGVADRIELRPWCTGATLRELTQGKRAMILSDIDGGEVALFTADVISSLGHCDLIVEVHGANQEANAPFVNLFRATHDVEVIEDPKTPGGVEMLSFLGEDGPRMATEYRPFQQWIVARARIRPPGFEPANPDTASANASKSV
jgi:hypothetical protein